MKTLHIALLPACTAYGVGIAPACGGQDTTGLVAAELVVSVADSGAYFFYDYTLHNPRTSTWGLAAVLIDVGASSGTPPSLASTGRLIDVTTEGAGQQPHVELGVDTPEPWKAIFDRTASLMWSAGWTIRTTADSIIPGDSLAGFGLRSSYLPGVRSMKSLPTLESCCREPSDTIEGELYWSGPEAFAADGYAVAPEFIPAEFTPEILRSQLEFVCGDTGWLVDGQACSAIGEDLDRTISAWQANDWELAAKVLAGVQSQIEASRPSFRTNGYWLMTVNTGALLDLAASGGR